MTYAFLDCDLSRAGRFKMEGVNAGKQGAGTEHAQVIPSGRRRTRYAVLPSIYRRRQLHSDTTRENRRRAEEGPGVEVGEGLMCAQFLYPGLWHVNMVACA